MPMKGRVSNRPIRGKEWSAAAESLHKKSVDEFVPNRHPVDPTSARRAGWLTWSTDLVMWSIEPVGPPLLAAGFHVTPWFPRGRRSGEEHAPSMGGARGDDVAEGRGP